MHKKIIASVLCVLMLSGFAACGQKGEQQGVRQESASKTPIEGTALPDFDPGYADNKNLYTNESLGFSAQLPPKWQIASQEEMQVMFEAAYEQSGYDDELFQRLKYLMIAFPKEVSGQEFISAAQYILERKSEELSARKVLELAQNDHLAAIDMGNDSIEIGEIEERNIDGQTVYYLCITIGEGDTQKTQELLTTDIGDFVLEISYAWVLEADGKLVADSIESIHFNR